MKKTMIVPFFIQHMGCPFTCVFCNQWKIAGKETTCPQEVIPRVKEYLQAAKEKPDWVEVAFFGGSFTGLSGDLQEKWLEKALELKQSGIINGIRLSTRPDYISEEILERLWRYGVTAVELGVQSMDDEVLKRSMRGHTRSDTHCATSMIREYPFQLVYQLMLGLPGDNEAAAMFTAEKTVRARPDGVRIYPAVVLKDTELAVWYRQGRYEPWTLKDAVAVGSEWLATFSLYKIKVLRMGLQFTPNLTTEKDLLAGPYHPAYGELVESRLMLKQIESLFNGLAADTGKATVLFNPRDYSKVLGQKKINAAHLAARLPHVFIEFWPDDCVAENDLKLEYKGITRLLSRQEFLEKYRIKNT